MFLQTRAMIAQCEHHLNSRTHENVTSRAQDALMAARRGGRKSTNGPPMWEAVCAPGVVTQDKLDAMASPDFKDVITWACDAYPALKHALSGYEEGGGGFSLMCPARGVASSVTGDVTWKLGCKSRHSLKCTASAMIILRFATKTLHLEVAKGWAHAHTGPIMTQTGLPPAIKVIIDSTVDMNPNIKLKGLKNILWEVHKLNKDDFDARITSYFYRGCKQRRASMDVTTGVSSYGTVNTFAESNLLFDLIEKHSPGVNTSYLDVAGVIGYFTDITAHQCYVIFSTVRLLVDGWLQASYGYSKGQRHIDFTHKLLQEQIPFYVSSVADIQQHVHPVSMGPCTHQTSEMIARIIKDEKTITVRLIGMIGSNVGWPGTWPAAARSTIHLAYHDLVCRGLVEAGIVPFTSSPIPPNAELFLIDHVMADAADAIGNAATTAFGPLCGILMCWVHVWRAVKAKYHLLKVNTEDRQKELYTDLSFVHHVAEPLLVPVALKRLYEKWEAYGEAQMVAYLQREWGRRLWMRAFTQPGEPGDNNTIEAYNRVLKTPDAGLGKQTSLALCCTSVKTAVHRTSRDVKPFASVDVPVVKKEKWVLAQKLVAKSHFKLAYKMGDKVIVPSEQLIAKLPGTTVSERRQNMNIWVKEFVSMMKNPGSYYKVHGPGAWSFDTLMDYIHSFYIIEPIPITHRHMSALANAGIVYKCNCPDFMHYHVCKHAIGYAIEQSKTTVPTSFSTATVGKRGASPGAKLAKRGKCLAITE